MNALEQITAAQARLKALPELPDPAMVFHTLDHKCDFADGVELLGATADFYTADQMRDYALQALAQECAMRDKERTTVEAGEAEPVAWQFRHRLRDTGYWSGWAQLNSEEACHEWTASYAAQGFESEWRALYTRPAPAAEAAPQGGFAGLDASGRPIYGAAPATPAMVANHTFHERWAAPQGGVKLNDPALQQQMDDGAARYRRVVAALDATPPSAPAVESEFGPLTEAELDAAREPVPSIRRLSAPVPQEGVDEAMVERIAALLHEETTGEPWTVAGVEHPGPDRDYYRGLARKVAALAAQGQGERGEGK